MTIVVIGTVTQVVVDGEFRQAVLIGEPSISAAEVMQNLASVVTANMIHLVEQYPPEEWFGHTIIVYQTNVGRLADGEINADGEIDVIAADGQKLDLPDLADDLDDDVADEIRQILDDKEF